MMAALDQRRCRPLLWPGLAVLILAVDYLTGPAIQFPILCLVPVALAAVYSGRLWGLLLAAGMPVVLLAYRAHWDGEIITLTAVVNAVIRIAVLVTFAILIESAVCVRALTKEMRTLKGIFPMCSYCRRIRTEDNRWVRVDEYVTEHSEAQFSHELCPACLREHYPDLQGAHVPEERHLTPCQAEARSGRAWAGGCAGASADGERP